MSNIDLRPAHLPITVYYKGDVSMQFSFTSGGVLYPLTDVTAASFVISEKNGTAALSLSSGSGLTINGAGGYIDMAITHAQIVTLYSQEYNYEFRLTLTGGTEWPVLDSYFTVSEDGQASVTGSDISVSLDGTSVDVSVISPAVSSGGGTWGSISGTLSDQTDLQTALDAKAATSHTHALSDITQSSATSGQVPKWNGSAWAQYRGIINLTSDNATEIIDTITNPPTLFPFTLRPQGFALTITGTAYAGIGAGQIALKATDYTLDGDKGEYIVLEIDPLGTGCLVEKYVVNGLI